MAESFGKKAKSSGERKRPAATIEGTATEISVGPRDESDASAPAAPAEPDVRDGNAHDARNEKIDGANVGTTPRTSRLGSFASHLFAGLLGGLIGATALALAWSNLDLGGEKAVAPQLATLDDRVARLESAPRPADPGQTLAALDTRVQALETRTPDAPPDAGAIAERVADAERKLNAKIDTAIAQTADANASTVQALQDQIAGLRTRLSALAEAGLAVEQAELLPAIEQLSERVAKLEAAMPGVAEAVSKETAEAKAATMTIAFANLRAAVSEGRPFSAELDTLKALAPDAADFGALAAYAKPGIPTVQELARSFQTAKEAALAKLAPVSDGSLLDNLMTNARSLVTVRRVDGPVAGSEPDAVLARAGAYLSDGRLSDAVKEVESLEAAPRTEFSAWLDQARARLGADESLRRLEGRLLVSVGKAALTKKQPMERD